MRVLVTGGAGFVGQWLIREMLARGWDVTAASVEQAAGRHATLTPTEYRSVKWLSADVRQDAEVSASVDASRPDMVVHLAGVSFVPQAAEAPAISYDVNVLGAVRLLNVLAIRKRVGTLDPVVLIIGSGTQYGRHEVSEMPLTEAAERRPMTTYAATKEAQEVAALQTFRAHGVRIVCTRSFNHTGPGHHAGFLLPALVERAIEAKRTNARAIVLGDANAIRDYLHVTDVVNAYLLLAEHGAPGETYNVCSGHGISARQLAETVLQRVGATADITSDPALVRDIDVPVLVGSPAKLQRTTGWMPEKTTDDIIGDLIHAATR